MRLSQLCLIPPLLSSLLLAEDTLPPCFFPESELHTFFYDVDSDIPPWTAIAESTVDPPGARILLASVRSEHPVGINFTEKFTLVSSPKGQFALYSVLPLTLPPHVNQTRLFVTVICNDAAFALFTVRVTSVDNGNPQFYNEPYYVDINERLSIGDTVITPIVVIDWESEEAAPKLHIEGVDSPFTIVTEVANSTTTPVVKVGLNRTTTRQPTLVLLKLVKPIKHLPITLKLVAEDAKDGSRASVTSIQIRAKPNTLRESGGHSKLITTIPPKLGATTTEVESSLVVGEVGRSSTKMSLTPSTNRPILFSVHTIPGRRRIHEGPNSVELEESNIATTSTSKSVYPDNVLQKGEWAFEDETKPRQKNLIESKHIDSPEERTRHKPADLPIASPELLTSLDKGETLVLEKNLIRRKQNDRIEAKNNSLHAESSALSRPNTKENVEKDKELQEDEESKSPPRKGGSSASAKTLVKTLETKSGPFKEYKLEDAENLENLPAKATISAKLPTELTDLTTTDLLLWEHSSETPERGRQQRTKVLTTTFSVPHDETRFDKCAETVSMKENSEVGTVVTTLNVLNRKEWTMIDMVNPDGTFEIQQKTGEVFIRDNRLMDRELFTQLELVAEIHGSSHITECARIRVSVELLDENDNKPTFETERYTFLISDEFPVEDVVGTIRARDIDEGEAGRVRYRLLNESTPFAIRRRGKDGEIVTTAELFGPKVFRLMVEASDSAPPFQFSRIPVDIIVSTSWLESTASTTTASEKPPFAPKRKASGVISASLEPLDLNAITESGLSTASGEGSTSDLPTGPPRVSSRAEKNRVGVTTTRSTTAITVTKPTEKLIGAVFTKTTTAEPIEESKNTIHVRPSMRKPTEKPLKPEHFHTLTAQSAEEPNNVDHIGISHTSLPSQESVGDESETSNEASSEASSDALREDDDEDYPSNSESSKNIASTYNGSFSFVEPSYYFEVFGSPREGDVMGRVEARPKAQMYGLEAKVARAFKVDTDIGEISVGRDLARASNGNHSFFISATDGVRTAQAVVTVHVDTRKNRNDAVPRFERSRYVFQVNENRAPSVVGVVRAYHVALSAKDVTLQYELVNDYNNLSLPFRVHPISGEVKSVTTLDYETTKNYEFKVRACLSLNPTNCGYTLVVVIVEDVNDNAPQFSSSEIRISLPSDLPSGADVITLQATDADSGLNGNVNYAINPPSEVFGIDFHTGTVQTLAALTEPLYDLTVEAFDSGKPKRSCTAKLIISVHGTNPSAPVFDQRQYEVIIKSPVRAGTIVTELHARDPDPGPEGQLTYSFGNTSGIRDQERVRKFSINEQTGVVSAVVPLTESDGPFDLVVAAEDRSTVFKRKATTNLHIDIVGETSLRFLPLPSTIYISTEKAVGSVVLRASAFTSSSEPVHFRVLENDAQFVMDGDLLRVASHLAAGETNLTVRAETESAHLDHRLRVVVMFDRDKYPVFPQLTYDIDIPVDSVFPLIAHRFDAHLLNGTLRYRFHPDSTASQGLHINPDTGELLVTSDYASFSSNHDTRFIVVRAVNINYPEFYSDVGVAISLISGGAIRFPHSIYRMQITENIPVGTTLIPPLEVFPKAANVTYSITPSSPLSILTNGTLVINSPIDLESLPVDQSSSLHFIITATSESKQAFTKLQLKVKDLNEFTPKFENKLYIASVDEDAVPGSAIVQVRATDADRTEETHLLYKIVGGSGRGLVFIQEDGTIVLGDFMLDREALEQFDVVVEAIDKSGNKDSATVHVTVGDVNDNSPVFSSKNCVWNVTEGSKDQVFEINASDKDAGRNAELNFRIVSGNRQNRFSLEKVSSQSATLKLNGPLDHETRSSYQLTLEARDGGRPPKSTTAVVTVNVLNRNDNPPIFRKINYEREVSSDVPVGYPILTLSLNDADRDRLTFSLSGNEDCSLLGIDKHGTVSFSKAVGAPSKITCIVSATDGVHTTNATLRLNVFESEQPTAETWQRNRAPRFGSEVYTITIDSLDSSRLLKKVKAVDPDNDVVSYSIEPPEFKNLFAVDEEGQVTARVPLDELKQALYSFLVVAADNGNPVMSSFTNIRVKMPENGNNVVTANSVDVAASKIVRPSTQERIRETQTAPAEWSTSRPSESASSEDITVTARTSTSTQIAATEIVLAMSTSSANSHPAVSFTRRKYTYAIRSNSPVGTYLGKVDLNKNAEVKLMFNSSKQFNIDAEGWIHSTVSFLRSEKIEDEILAVENGTVVASAPFAVHVLEPEPKDILLPISSATGTLTAFHNETTNMPTISTTTQSLHFSVRKDIIETTHTEGQPTTTESFITSAAQTIWSSTTKTSASEESTVPSTRTTVLQFHDTSNVEGNFTLSTMSTVTSSTSFAFLRSIYFAFVPEGQYSNGIRLAVKPEPLSVNRKTMVRYELDDAVQNIPFFLTPDGQLIIFDVDRETNSSYMFTVKATSPEFGVTKAMMNVTILDTNDNYPVFDPAPSAIGLYKDAPVGTPLYHFRAADKDADNYGAVTFGLEEPESPFEVNPNDGTLFIAYALDSTPEYTVTVVAKDNGRPSLKTVQKISVRIFDPSVEAPRFPKEQSEKVVFFGTQPQAEVAALLAGPTINTKSNQERILYGLVDNANGLFSIEDGGRLVLRRRPNADEQDRYIQLNVTAENSHGKDSTLLNVFVEGNTTSTSAPGKFEDHFCYFPQQVHTAEIMENRPGRKQVLKVTSSCETEGRPYVYAFSYPISGFELDSRTGELFVTLPLDREDRSHHFLYIEVTNGSAAIARRITRGDPLIEKAKEHLNRTQTLVAIRVLDENDNAPAFLHGSEDDDSLMTTVDWQARLFTPIIRLEANDPDERPQLSYSLTGEGADYFRVNATSGLVILLKSLAGFTGDSFQLSATVTDGLHIVATPLRIYVISPLSSVVQLTSEVPHTKIDQRMVERTLNEINGLDNRLLVKQPYVDQQGHADPTRSHLFVYALDSKTKIPYLKEDLVKVLEHHSASLLSSPPRISEILLLSPPSITLSAFDLALAIVCALLLLFLVGACCFLASYCKRKRVIATSDREYMVSSSTGPRPYDVLEVSRTTAQRVLSAQPLPDPMTNQIEVAVSPIFMDDMVSTNKSDTTKDFYNSIRERPSLLQSALARQKIHAAEVNPIKSPQK